MVAGAAVPATGGIPAVCGGGGRYTLVATAAFGGPPAVGGGLLTAAVPAAAAIGMVLLATKFVILLVGLCFILAKIGVPLKSLT